MLASHVDTILIVQQAKSGNLEAFAALLQNYEHDVYGYLAGQLGNRDEAADYVQQVFFKAWINLPTLKDNTCFKAWLYTIAKNLLLDRWRVKKAYHQSWEHLEVSHAVEGSTGLEDCVAKAEMIGQVLAALSPKFRQCLMLRFVGGFPDHEIAEKVGISAASVGTYVCSARKQFRELYQRLNEEGEI